MTTSTTTDYWLPTGSVKRPEQYVLAERMRRVPAMMGYESGFVGTFKFAPSHPDQVLGSRAYELIEDMMTMAPVRSAVNVKRYAILRKGWKIIPKVLDPTHPDQKKSAEIGAFCKDCLENIVSESGVPQDFRQVLFAILRATFQGFSVQEIILKAEEDGENAGKWILGRVVERRAKQIGFDLDPFDLAPVNLVGYSTGGGYTPPVPIEKFVLYTHAPQHGLPHGDGDWRSVYKHWWTLDTVIKLWAVSIEVFGGPFMMARGAVTDEESMTDILNRLKEVRQSGVCLLPDNITAEVINMAFNPFEGFEKKAEWHVRQIKEGICGQTLTTSQGTGVGAYALGSVHADTADYVYSFARTDVEELVRSQILSKLVKYNFGQEYVRLTPKLSLGAWDLTDKLLLAQTMQIYLQNEVLWKDEAFIREEAEMPPMDDESKKARDEFQRQMLVMKQQQINQRNAANGQREKAKTNAV